MRKALAFMVFILLAMGMRAEKLGYTDPGDRDVTQLMQHLVENDQWQTFQELLPLVTERLAQAGSGPWQQKRLFGMIRLLVGKGRLQEARSLMNLARHVMPNAWWLWGVEQTWYRGHGIERSPNGRRLVAETSGIVSDFQAGMVLLQVLERALYWSGVIVLWLFALYHFHRYFPLLSRDSLVGEQGQVLWARLGAHLFMLVLPLLFGAGLFLLAVPMVLLGIVRVYLNEDERHALRFQFVAALLVLLLLLVPAALLRQASTPEFQRILDLGLNGRIKVGQPSTPDEKVLTALGILQRKGLSCTDEMVPLLEGTQGTHLGALRLHLLGIVSLRKGDASQAGKYLLDALAIDDRDPELLSNFSLAVLSGKEPNLDRVIQSYSVRFPRFPEAQAHLQGIRIPHLKPFWAWNLLVHGSAGDDELWWFWGHRLLVQILHMPFVLFFLLVPLIGMVVGRLLGVDGKGSFCPKCRRPVKRKPAQMLTRPLCEDCHQIFLIKDVVFLEAKMQKEKEYARQEQKRKLCMMAVSLLWPGFCGFLKDRQSLVVLSQLSFVSLLSIFLYGRALMLRFWAVVPMVISLAGFMALGVYLVVNLLSVWGED